MAKPLSRRQMRAERRKLDERLNAFLDKGQTREAFRMEPEYRDLARRSGSPEVLGYFLLDLGDAHYQEEEYGEALKYYMAGLSELGSDPLEQGVAALQVAYCYSFQQRSEEALRWLDRCLENRSLYQNGRAAAFSERARIEVERYQRYTDAIYHYLCALELYDARKPLYSPEGHQATLFGLALTFDESRLPSYARTYYQKVVRFGHPEYGYVKEAKEGLKNLEKTADPIP